MSRIRIVKGIYNKITHGDHQMFSKENINSFAGNVVGEKGEEDGVIHDSPSSPPPPEIMAKCMVEFRPNASWQGEFGFDWDRKADSKMQVYIPYNSIIGNYSKESTFKANINKYIEHRQAYGAFSVSGSMYYTPNMTLKSGASAKLDASIKVDESPDKLHYVYETDIFQVTILQQLATSVGTHFNQNTIEIKCLKNFSSEKSIRVIATKNKIERKVGEIKMLPNNNIKNVNVVFVPVRDKKTGNAGSVVRVEKQMLINALNQSYIEAHITDCPMLNIGGMWFEWFFTTKNGAGNRVMDVSNWSSIHNYLDAAFFDVPGNDKYKKYYRVYMLPTGILNGIAEDIGNAYAVVVYQNRNKTTTAHEILHAMGLYHSFDDDGKFTYKKHCTDNIMDYTHQVGKERFSTNRWQWKILNSTVR